MAAIEAAPETVSLSPATGAIIGVSALNTALDLTRAVARAREAQPAWAEARVDLRADHLRRVTDFIVEHAEDLAAVISVDNGKTRVDALATEVLPAVMAGRYYAQKARSFLRPRRLGAGGLLLANKRSRLWRVPYGVIGIISPWNYPFAIPFSEVVMGLLAGNAVVLKTATETQAVGRFLEKCFSSAELPAGVFSYVNLPGRVAGEAMLEAEVDKLFFTGSVAVGKKLMAKAAETLTPVSLELGGNDAMIVLEDADLARAAAGALWAGFSNCGQSCGGVERIYVWREVYDAFLAELKPRVERLRVGPDENFDVDLGAMTTSRQMETVRRHIDEALTQGAKIFAQSAAPGGDGNFLPATVLTGVTHDMAIMREETFGPVIGVMAVADEDEAVALANDSPLGLTGSVWSRDRRRAEAVGRRIRAGAITINDHLMSHGLPATPWGGFKESGLGRTHGALGFDEMTEPQVIVHDALPGVKKNLWWHPYSKRVYQGLLGALQGFYGHGLGRRLGGLLRAARIMGRIFRK
ncbi:MAG: aldehyde dehydrogenase family protein [Proteobacteria bacterium]|nr:aldehyde dehydrogenase family protein [Pseudomonadota bacterium]